ncbi:hypothetical protein ACH95_01655 [Bacillus glycinifermentans]|uniref:Holin n=1 Tax=Bacillus glycinifermentans TaxID=1664069 RepID=A0A0J6EZX5_9BACI|nr:MULTISPECIES: hypothetical protein [Bacillus]ATH94146.1 hypothetical protein COP00_17290 [Bacillus glycinifermentans]KMM63378.1 hypothetical protein ACH95_01655 [Bacillus glycinifermentans]KRT95575.1 hypothetical protein AB447_200200 [Bacillus glycinifermentans]MEC0484554.1 hypothetical protein [Bacillus glycinifermentans]MEC0491553.1 hypothetical protein [Bacillus licheniformis]
MGFFNFYNDIILGGALPTLGGIQGWVKDVVTQFAFIVGAFLASKHLLKLRVGGIVFGCCVASAVGWAVNHWSTLSGWVENLIDKL